VRAGAEDASARDGMRMSDKEGDSAHKNLMIKTHTTVAAQTKTPRRTL
jgi:hypothetical protein